jgi:sporulation protein YlmC with PRC-barrel domain
MFFANIFFRLNTVVGLVKEALIYMALLKFKDAYPKHNETFRGNNGNDGISANVDDYSVYTNPDNKIGSVQDMLFEDMTGNIRYLIVDTGFWIFGKNVLLPIGLAHFDDEHHRVYVDGLSKQQVENLPEYHEDTTVDRDYEERVRNSYRTQGTNRSRQYQR